MEAKRFREEFIFEMIPRKLSRLPVHWLGGIILKPEYEGHILASLTVSGHFTRQHSGHPLQSEHRGNGNWNWHRYDTLIYGLTMVWPTIIRQIISIQPAMSQIVVIFSLQGTLRKVIFQLSLSTQKTFIFYDRNKNVAAFGKITLLQHRKHPCSTFRAGKLGAERGRMSVLVGEMVITVFCSSLSCLLCQSVCQPQFPG